MNNTSDTTTTDNGGDFDARAAAALLDKTTLRARRQFEPYPPWLLVIRAVMALVALRRDLAFGARAESLRISDAAVIPVGVAVGIVNVVATVATAKRATAGSGGRSRLLPAQIILLTVAWIASGRGHGAAGRGRGATRSSTGSIRPRRL